jgi:hypothetical protein
MLKGYVDAYSAFGEKKFRGLMNGNSLNNMVNEDGD